MAPFGASRAGLMSVAEDDIPDSDLTQYSLTDSNDRISVTSSDSYDGTDITANDEFRLYDSVDIDDDLNRILDFNVLAGTDDGELYYVGFGDSADEDRESIDNFAGVYIENSDGEGVVVGINFREGSPPQDNIVVTGLDREVEYTIEQRFDFESNEIIVEVFNPDGNSEGEGTEPIPDVDWSHDYAAMGANAGFSDPGEMDIQVSNYRFEPV